MQARLAQVTGDAAQRSAAAERDGRELRMGLEALQQQLKAAQAEQAKVQQQASQLAAAKQTLERESLLLKGEGERLGRELTAVRTRAERLEQAVRAASGQLGQVLAQQPAQSPGQGGG